LAQKLLRKYASLQTSFQIGWDKGFVMESHSMPPADTTSLPSHFPHATNEVVELLLVLPVGQAEALIRLSRCRQTSVAKILRQLIDEALTRSE
jgi:hypothetical protein